MFNVANRWFDKTGDRVSQVEGSKCPGGWDGNGDGACGRVVLF